MATPNKLRTQAVDTSKTTPEAFLAGASAPVLTGPPAASSPPEPEAQAEAPAAPAQIPQVTPVAAHGVVTTPTAIPDLFVWVSRGGSTARVARTLRAMEVPGGLVVKSSFAMNGQMGEALCFIPGLKIADLTSAITPAI